LGSWEGVIHLINTSIMAQGNRFLFFIFFNIAAILPGLVFAAPQEVRVNQKKIERDRAKKEKQALKEYDKAVKQHNKKQSKSTKASMKKTKKESEKLTPLKH
jgi:uncharacterized membrane protein (DUF106 family)